MDKGILAPFAITFFMLLAGCAATSDSQHAFIINKPDSAAISTPLPEKIDRLDFTKFRPVRHVELAQKYAYEVIQPQLINPEGMRLDISGTKDILMPVVCGTLDGKKEAIAWVTEISINAKNANGKYAGSQSYTLFFNLGVIAGYRQAHYTMFNKKLPYGIRSVCPQELLRLRFDVV